MEHISVLIEAEKALEEAEEIAFGKKEEKKKGDASTDDKSSNEKDRQPDNKNTDIITTDRLSLQSKVEEVNIKGVDSDEVKQAATEDKENATNNERRGSRGEKEAVKSGETTSRDNNLICSGKPDLIKEAVTAEQKNKAGGDETKAGSGGGASLGKLPTYLERTKAGEGIVRKAEEDAKIIEEQARNIEMTETQSEHVRMTAEKTVEEKDPAKLGDKILEKESDDGFTKE